MIHKKIIIFGGSGSLGYQLTKQLLNDNEIFCYSRDESKHWKMAIYFNNN